MATDAVTYRRLSDWLIPGMIALMTCAIGWVASSIGNMVSAQNRLSEKVAVVLVRLDDHDRRLNVVEDESKLQSDVIGELLQAHEVDALGPHRPQRTSRRARQQ